MTNQTCVSPAHASTGTPDHTNSAVVVCPLYTYAQSECLCMRTYARGQCLCMCWIVSFVHSAVTEEDMFACPPPRCCVCCVYACSVFWLPVCIPVCRWYAFAGILVGMRTIACLI